jgi:hypothetical protein
MKTLIHDARLLEQFESMTNADLHDFILDAHKQFSPSMSDKDAERLQSVIDHAMHVHMKR